MIVLAVVFLFEVSAVGREFRRDAVGREFRRDVRRSFLFKHYAKAGGSFVKTLLRATLPHDALVVVPEFSSYPRLRKKFPHSFTMGGTRNPCSYYVSLWSFGNEESGLFYWKTEDKEKYYSTDPAKQTKKLFRTWLNHINSVAGKPDFGMVTGRFWASYLGDDARAMAVPLEINMNDKVLKKSAALLKDLDHWDPKTEVDCWYRTEDLVANVRSCLQKYEKKTGAKLDWEKFEAKLGDPDTRRNPSSHAPYMEYIDDETEAQINKSDRRIFDMFGYTCKGDTKKPSLFG